MIVVAQSIHLLADHVLCGGDFGGRFIYIYIYNIIWDLCNFVEM